MDLDRTGLDDTLFEMFSEVLSGVGLFMVNMDTGVSRWSKNAVDYFGLPGEYLTDSQKIWPDIVHPSHLDGLLATTESILIREKEKYSVEYYVKNKNGDYVVCTINGKLHQNDDGGHFFVGSVQNHGVLDNVDPVTGLYNVYEYSKTIRAIRLKNIHSVVLVAGFRNFHSVNNVYSYEFGNNVLKTFANQVHEIVADMDTAEIYRLEGSKFAVCIKDFGREETIEFYERLRAMSRDLIVNGTHISLEMQAGAVLIGEDTEGKHSDYTIQTSVDNAYKSSKNEANGELVFYDTRFYNESRRKLLLIDKLHLCVMNSCEGFSLRYQPIVNSADGSLHGAEALLRWEMDPFGPVSPAEFVPLLENDPCFIDLGNWILENAMMQMKEVVEKLPEFVLNVNLSYSQMKHKNFRYELMKIIEKAGFPPENLCVELTERGRALDTDYLEQMMTYFRAQGLKSAIDDFGTGISSLCLLRQLPVDYLKIDRVFIKNIRDNKNDQSIVKAITNCAKDMDIKVCFEGIEDEELEEFVSQYDASLHQGYKYSVPLTLDEFLEKWIKD